MSMLPPIRGHRPWRAVRSDGRSRKHREHGWFVSCGIGCPLPKDIHWGKVRGWLPAWIDTLRLAVKGGHR